MPVLNTLEELAKALENPSFVADPIADLAEKGYTLSSALNAQWQAARAGRPLPPIPHGVTPASFKGKFAFRAPGTTPAVPLIAAPDGYDIVAGFSLPDTLYALTALYQSGTIPHQIALDQLLSKTDLTALGGLFRVDKPGGQISRFKIPGAPVLSAIADGSSQGTVQIPFELDWDHVRVFAGQEIRQTITSAIGTLQLTMQLSAKTVLRPQIENSTLTIAAQLITDVNPANSPRLLIAPGSAVQLSRQVPPNEIDGAAVLIQNAIALYYLTDGLSWTVSPHIVLGAGDIDITRVDVVTAGGALVAGVQVAGTDGAPNPALLANLLPNSESNVFVSIRDSAANALVQQELHSGALTAAAKEKHDNAVVESASASFQNNALVAQVSGRLVNECLDSIDLGFIATRTVSLSLQGGSLVVNQSDDNSIAEWSNMWCLLASLGLIGLAVLAGAILEGAALAVSAGVLGFLLTGVGPFLVDQAIQGIFGGGSPDASIVALTLPIPGSDYLVAIFGGSVQTTDGALLVAATAGIELDNVNTVLYVRFLVPAGITAFTTRPLAGAKVELMDQDAPQPQGDDVLVVVPGDTTTTNKNDVVTTTTHSFEPPTSDEILAEGKTDLDGIVRFALLREQLASTMGKIKIVTTRTNLDTDATTTVTGHSPIPEAKPDLYFRVTMPDGSTKDTRQLQGGFLENFTSSRIGSLGNPLTFSFGGVVIVHQAGSAS